MQKATYMNSKGPIMFKNLNPGSLGFQATQTQAVEWAQAAGFAGADLVIDDAMKLEQENSSGYVKELFSRAGLKAGAWFPEVDWRADDSRFYSELSRLPAKARLAADLGCMRCITYVIPIHDTLSFRENWAFHVRRLRAMAEILNDHGHRFGLEFIGPAKSRVGKKYGFLNSIDGMLGLCQTIGTGNMGLLFDVWHWYTSHGTLDDIRQWSNSDIVCVHLNDAPAGIETDKLEDCVRELPGATGLIPLKDFLRALHGIGYDGPVTVEPFDAKLVKMGPLDGAKAAARALDSVWKAAKLQ